MIKALIFDYFGVLSSEVAPLWFQNNVAENDIIALKDKYVRPADKGEISEEELFNQLSVLSKIPAKKISEQWSELIHINIELLDFIKEKLVGKYKLGILTNATPNFFNRVLKQYPLKDIFDVIVVSSEIGYAKPEPEAYKSILKALSVEPNETLMIDDSIVNIEGAKAVGISGFLFTSNNQLIKDLKL